jgi:class 3 adenylate cyclase
MTRAADRQPSMWQNVASRIGNPLEWSFVDRASLLAGSSLFLLVIMVIIVNLGGISVGFVSLKTPFGVNAVQKAAAFSFLAAALMMSLMFLVCLGLRRRHSEARWPAYLLAVFLTANNVWWMVLIGLTTNPFTFMLIFLNIFIGLLLFDRIFCWLTIVSWVVFLGCGISLEQAGIIPYAPFAHQITGMSVTITPVWLILCWGFGITVITCLLLLVGFIMQRWRQREAQVVEMSGVLKKMFGRYLSTEVMNSIIENPASLEMGGEERRVTIMMTDLRGFTALSERLDPEQVVQMLNTYFEIMVNLVLKYNGTINGIIGDALLVVFGAPQEMSDRAQRAVACAIEMQNAMQQVNIQNRSQGLPELEMGIALHDANVIVGNVGSSKRSTYTVIGSGVNLTSRIESYSIGGQILVSESIRKKLGDQLRIDGQREVFPKGAETPLQIYEVGGIAGDYNLVLEGDEPELVPLARLIPVSYSVLDGKDVGKKGAEGMVACLSPKNAEMDLGVPLGPLTNLKMNLKNVDDDLKSRDFYGKVIDRTGEDKTSYMVRFTALPPEVKAYFQSHRQHSVTSR